ncbi:hypothetical protein [Saccharothrix texasensis]|uniref:DUF4352 domain-containing protein n=1 Tax=Saccharothrix texasensis TaxID=103734 RepID=A0A3N1H5E4_9PSEU|nr:hypothetical protein [Saccharothrix texasensis]ROP37739.1 hypothetical protein EDD40_3061 [Saccharothrix texasensis]
MALSGRAPSAAAGPPGPGQCQEHASVFTSEVAEEFDEILNGSTNQGQRYTWGSGLAVEISAPTSCEPGQHAVAPDVVRAAKVTVTVINGTGRRFDVGVLSFRREAQFDGRKAEAVFDSGGPCGGGGLESATVLPGKSYTYDMAFAVGAQAGELQITLQPDFGSDKAVFVGIA